MWREHQAERRHTSRQVGPPRLHPLTRNTLKVHRLDVGDGLLEQLSTLAVVLLCATHKRGQPCFDIYLSELPCLVHSLRVVLTRLNDETHRLSLIRGVWLLIILCYVTQLRPVLDPSLISEPDGENQTWEAVFSELRESQGIQGKYLDPHFTRAVRSIRELSTMPGGEGAGLYVRAAWKLSTEWTGWVGVGNETEQTLNIRL